MSHVTECFGENRPGRCYGRHARAGGRWAGRWLFLVRFLPKYKYKCSRVFSSPPLLVGAISCEQRPQFVASRSVARDASFWGAAALTEQFSRLLQPVRVVGCLWQRQPQKKFTSSAPTRVTRVHERLVDRRNFFDLIHRSTISS